ncbi:hypothetical protein R0J90_15770, partial [Micrococcus sp. SIMBA_144]
TPNKIYQKTCRQPIVGSLHVLDIVTEIKIRNLLFPTSPNNKKDNLPFRSLSPSSLTSFDYLATCSIFNL